MLIQAPEFQSKLNIIIYFIQASKWNKNYLPVLKAAFTKPFLNASFNLGFIEKFKAPPVTDIKSLGASNFQQENNSLIIFSMDVF